MKKIVQNLSTAVVFLVILTGCANIYKMNKAELNAVPIADVKTNPAKWENIGKEILDGKEFVFLIAKGQTVPVMLQFSTPFMRLNPGTNSVTFDRDMYVLISRTKMRVSPDGESWADIYDMRSMKTLLGWEKGDITLGFSATKETGSLINLNVTAR